MVFGATVHAFLDASSNHGSKYGQYGDEQLLPRRSACKPRGLGVVTYLPLLTPLLLCRNGALARTQSSFKNLPTEHHRMVEPHSESHGSSFHLGALTKTLRINQETEVQARPCLAYQNSFRGNNGPTSRPRELVKESCGELGTLVGYNTCQVDYLHMARPCSATSSNHSQ